MKKQLLLLLMTLLPVLANAYDAYINGIYYNFSGDEAEVTYQKYQNYTYTSDYSGAIVIPEFVTYNGKTYTVTSIGYCAFLGCSSLNSVTIPNSVTSIGTRAFYGCSSLTSIIIPKSVTSIAWGTFYGCSGLQKVIVPDIDIAAWCRISFGDGDANPLYYAHHLYSDEETEITDLIIPEVVTSIGGFAFFGCSGLTSVTIPNNVTSIGNDAFHGCSGLTSVHILDLEAWCKIAFGGSSSNPINYAHHLFLNGVEIRDLVIPSSLTSIGNDAFCGCSGLTSVTIPYSVNRIGDRAFLSCSGLTSITIPNSVTSIGNSAFSGCTGLTSITIPNSVTSIGDAAFSGCSGLTSITISNSVTSIGSNAFRGCTSLKYNEYSNAYYLGNSYNPYHALIKGSSFSITNCIINEECRIISSSAFENCSKLTSITIGNNVTSIGGSVFYGCKGLTSVTIPNSVTSIGNNAFSGCSGLTTVNIPNSVTSIGNMAFNSCTSLHYNEYNNTCYLGNSENPYVVLIKASNRDISTCEINTKCKVIYSEAFSGCSSLTSVTIPNSVTSISGYAFYKCSGLTSVTIGNSVTSIGSEAFCGCSGLTSVTFPNNLLYIGYHTFASNVYNDSGTINAHYYVNRGTDGLVAVWNYGINPYETGTSQILSRPSLTAISKTQATITYQVNNDVYPDLVFECSGNGESLGNDKYLMKGLRPEAGYTIELTIRSANNTYSTSITQTTLSLSPTISSESVTASSISLKGCYTEGDANIISHSIVIDGNKMEWDEGTLHGLDPNTTYNCKYNIVVGYGNGSTYTYEASKNIKTAELTLTTQQPKVISDGNVILAAQTNLDDGETNAGFEWRRTDWTDDFDSKSGTAIIYDGMMEGYIRSINSNFLWKFRPYYTSNAGNTYYGEWKGLDPSDYSYFEPTVHTYATINVQGNSAEVKGYAMRGTDKITSQGFMYWKNTSSYSLRKKAASIPADAVTVIASGNVMTATFEDLDYDTEYCCVAFVTTEENETFFGEVQTFATNVDPDGIGDIMATEDAVEVARYNLSGRMIDKPQKGINIIRYSDGTTRKVLIK